MKKYLYIVAAFLFFSCSQNETFEAGPSVPANCQMVHFDESNEALTMLIASESNRSVEYSVKRNNTNGALTIPVTIHSKSEGLVLDDNISFDDGDSLTSFVVTAPQEVKDGTTFDFDVELEGGDVNPYVQGATRFSGSISFPMKRYARMWFTGMAEELGYFLQDFYDLGNGSLCAPDFLHSGTDVWIRYDVNATSLVECDLSTSPSLVENDADNPGCYYVYAWDENKDENDGYTMFYPNGKDAKVSITYMTFYVSGDGYQATVYNPTNNSGWTLLSEIQFSNKETLSNWKYLNWVFTDDPENDGYEYGEPDPTNIKKGTVLDCTARFNFDDYSLGKLSMQAVVEGKNKLRFDDFMGSGIPVVIEYMGDGTLQIDCSTGYVEKNVWYFRNPDTKEWIDCYPAGPGTTRFNYSISLKNKENVINYADPTIKVKLHFKDIYKDGKTNGFDDFLMMSW